MLEFLFGYLLGRSGDSQKSGERVIIGLAVVLALVGCVLVAALVRHWITT